MTLQMSQTLSLSTFMQAAVTFPGCYVLKYLLNIVGFNELTMEWQVVARALMSNVATASHKIAFQKIMNIVTEDHAHFKAGCETAVLVVDFSDAQTAALEETLGETAMKDIRGCKVHYTRLCYKVADKVCTELEERQVSLDIARAIPDVKKI